MQDEDTPNMPPGRPPAEPWHLDRKVPIALIATILAQTVAIVWWASGIHHRVASVEATQLILTARTSAIEATGRAELAALRTELQARYDRMVENQRGLSEQIIEQRADVKAIRATLERLERQIETAGRATPPVRRE